MPRKLNLDENEIRRLHSQGLTDGEIARKLGCSGSLIHGQRKQLGLASNGRGKRNAKAVQAKASTDGERVTVSVALLDGIWNRLNPAVKAELLAKLD